MEPESQPPKKTLIVISPSMHGKSSFVSMLIEPRDDLLELNINPNITINTDGNHGTTSFQSFEVHPSHNLLGNNEKLFVMECPGIENDNKAIEFVQYFNKLIFENQIIVVGIAYVIDIREMKKNGEKQFCIQNFIKQFELEKDYKKEMLFYVMTKWDEIENDEKEIAELKQSFDKILEDESLKRSEENTIQWISKPVKHFEKYKQKVEIKKSLELLTNAISQKNPDGFKFTESMKPIVDKQWIKLEIILSDLNSKIQFFTRPKKVLIVVGRSGHGKSSFISMLIEPREDHKELNIHERIKISTGAGNGTTDCQIFEVHPSHNLLKNHERLLIIDSKGLDSEDNAHEITQQIDDLVYHEKLQIVGIAYVMNLFGRQEQAGGESFIGKFIQNLKLMKSYKENLIFYVFSQWDQRYREPEGIKSCEESFYKILENEKLIINEEKIIRWISKPKEDFENYEDRLEENVTREKILAYYSEKKIYSSNSNQTLIKQIINNQWKKLQNVVAHLAPQACPISEYCSNIEKYYQQILTIINNNVNQIQFKNQEYSYIIPLDRSKKENKQKLGKWKKIINFGLNLSGLVIFVPVVGVAFGAIGAAAYGVGQLGLNSTINEYESGLRTKSNRETISIENENLLAISLCRYMAHTFISNIKINDLTIEYEFFEWIVNAQITQFIDKGSVGTQNLNKKKEIIELKIPTTENEKIELEFKFTFKIPNWIEIKNDIIKTVNDIYNSEKK